MLDVFAYNLGYWTARSGQPGVFVSASLRVGYQHGAVDLALDSSDVQGELRETLRALSRAHEAWFAAAAASDRAASKPRAIVPRAPRRGNLSGSRHSGVSPAPWARVHIAPASTSFCSPLPSRESTPAPGGRWRSIPSLYVQPVRRDHRALRPKGSYPTSHAMKYRLPGEPFREAMNRIAGPSATIRRTSMFRDCTWTCGTCRRDASRRRSARAST